MSTEFRIGEVAALSGISVDAVRYYERRRLLPAAPRTSGGYRVFSAETIERLHFIKQAQGLGFTLDEIATLISTNGSRDCLKVHDLIDAKVKELDARMRSMHEFREKLSAYLAECKQELKQNPDYPSCPVVVELGHAEHC